MSATMLKSETNALVKDYLSTKEAMVYLDCCRSTISKLADGGKIQRYKLENGRNYYSRKQLKELIEKGIKAE